MITFNSDGEFPAWAREEIDMAEGGDLQAIHWIATCHPVPEEREMWLSIWYGELDVLGLLRGARAVGR